MTDELLTIGQAADYVDVTVVTFFSVCEAYKIMPASTENGVPLYRQVDLDQAKRDAQGEK